MYKYKPKSVFVRAVQLSDMTMPDWLIEAIHEGSIICKNETGKIEDDYIEAINPSCVYIGRKGDWVIRKTKGEYITVSDKLFKETFEEVK